MPKHYLKTYNAHCRNRAYHIKHIIHQRYRCFFFLATPETQQMMQPQKLNNHHSAPLIHNTN